MSVKPRLPPTQPPSLPFKVRDKGDRSAVFAAGLELKPFYPLQFGIFFDQGPGEALEPFTEVPFPLDDALELYPLELLGPERGHDDIFTAEGCPAQVVIEAHHERHDHPGRYGKGHHDLDEGKAALAS